MKIFMMKFPAKSKFGGETTFLWFGWKDLEDIILNPLNEEWYYNLSREHKEKMDINLKENLDKLEKPAKIVEDKAIRDKVNEAFTTKETDKK